MTIAGIAVETFDEGIISCDERSDAGTRRCFGTIVYVMAENTY